MKRARFRSILLRYSISVGAVAFVVLLRLALMPLLEPETPFLLFIAAVLVSAWFGGLWPGILATVLAVVANNYFFMVPFFAFDFIHPIQRLRMFLFLTEGVFISIFSAVLQRARRRADEHAMEALHLERRILEVSEREQRRIGHDLHDGLGQHLTGIALMSRVLAKHLEADHSTQAGDAAKISALVNQAIQWTRDLSAGLWPIEPHRDTLAAALAELCSRTQEMTRIDCRFHGDDSISLPDPSTMVHLYRIAQEAINNSLKHAKAKQIDVRLVQESDNVVVVTIEDDGVGIAEAVTSSGKSGMGLKTMEYRARIIGATLDVRRRLSGAGTAVRCICPIRPAKEPTDSGDILPEPH